MEGLSVDMVSTTAQDRKGFHKPNFGQGQPHIKLLH
jgi:hypothetical protein